MAPRPPSLDFFGPVVLVIELVVVDEVDREAFGFEVDRLTFVVDVERMEEDVTVRGVLFCGGVARPITGGGAGLGVVDLAGELTGLFHEVKKSSSSLEAALASADDVTSGMPST